MARRVVAVFEEPFTVDDQDVLMRPSIGVAVASTTEPDLAPESLIRRAEIAMNAAKRARSSDVYLFDAEMLHSDDVAGHAPR